VPNHRGAIHPHDAMSQGGAAECPKQVGKLFRSDGWDPAPVLQRLLGIEAFLLTELTSRLRAEADY
jgi:hypothetical protein